MHLQPSLLDACNHKVCCVASIAIRTYSTCSFNPLENEAVVAALLLRTGAVLEGAPALEGLPTRPGLTTWAVLDDGEELYPQSYSILTQSSHLWPSLTLWLKI